MPQSAQSADPAPPLPQGQLVAEPVPDAQREQPQPIMKILMPVIMVLAIGAMVVMVVLSGRQLSPMMLIFPLMMVVSVMMMLNPADKTGNIDETRRVYLRHLDALAAQARTNARLQRDHVTHHHPAPGALVHATPTSRVWERGVDSPRAFEVRLGLGQAQLSTPIDVGDPGSPEDLDPVCAVSLRRTVAAVSTVPDMPIIVQLRAFPIVNLSGPRAAEVAAAVLCELAFFHGPEMCGIVNLHPDSEFGWLKWLPHTGEPDRAALCVALTDSAQFHSALLASEVDCVIVVDPDPDYVAHEDALHLVCDEEITARTMQGDERLGILDDFSLRQAELLARHLAFYRRPEESGAAGHAGDLLAMLGYSDVDELNAHAMWQGRQGTRHHLVVPIGATPEGVPVHLDLKESALGGMGPHGLCIGATGSGKSEPCLWLQ